MVNVFKWLSIRRQTWCLCKELEKTYKKKKNLIVKNEQDLKELSSFGIVGDIYQRKVLVVSTTFKNMITSRREVVHLVG